MSWHPIGGYMRVDILDAYQSVVLLLQKKCNKDAGPYDCLYCKKRSLCSLVCGESSPEFKLKQIAAFREEHRAKTKIR